MLTKMPDRHSEIPASKKALIIKLFAAGDVVMATPVAQALGENGYHVSWLAGEWSAELLKENPFVHKTFAYPDKIFYDTSLLSKLSVARTLHREQFDVVVVLHDHPLVKMFAKTLGAKRVLFFARGDGGERHQGKAYFHVLSSLGISGEMPYPKLFLSRVEENEALSFFQRFSIPPDSSIIGFAPGGGMNPKTMFALKRWGVEKYQELARFLIKKCAARIFVFGHHDEHALCEEVRCANPDRIVNAAGTLSLRETAAIIKYCHLVVGADSAPVHIASAFGVPSVVLFGPTNPDVWKPVAPQDVSVHVLKENYDCMPCYKDDGIFPSCPYDHRCMKTLSAERVFSACEEMIDRVLPRI